MFAFFGPGAILASCAIGNGESVLSIRLGAWSGYQFLWVALAATVTKQVLITYMIGRYTAISGESVASGWARFPGPRGWFLILILSADLVALPFGLGAMARAAGQLIQSVSSELFGINYGNPVLVQNLSGGFFTAVAILLGIWISYEKFELQHVIIGGILVAGTGLGALLAGPSLLSAIKGTLVFWDWPDFPEWALVAEYGISRDRTVGLEVATTFGYFGNVMMGYVVYSSLVKQKQWGMTRSPRLKTIQERATSSRTVDYLPDDPAEIVKAHQGLLPLKLDLFLGGAAFYIVTGAFILAGAAIMAPAQLVPSFEDLLGQQKIVWDQISPAISWLYYVVILLAYWGSFNALPEFSARVTQEFMMAISGKMARISFRAYSIVMGVFLAVSSVIVLFLNINAGVLMDLVSLISTNSGVGLVGLAAIYLNFRLPKSYRARPLTVLLAILSCLVILYFGGISFTEFTRANLGWFQAY